MRIVFTTIFTILGIFVANIIYSIVYRYYNGVPIFKVKSFCPVCQQQFLWYDSLPFLGFIIQGGKCRHCHKKLDIYQFLAEFISGVLFGFSFYKYNFSFVLLIEILTIILIITIMSVYKFSNNINEECLIIYVILALVYILKIYDNIYWLDVLLGGLVSLFLVILIDFKLNEIPKLEFINLNSCFFIIFSGLLLTWKGLIIALLISIVLGIIIELIKFDKNQKNKISILLYFTFGLLITIIFKDEIIYLINNFI